MEGTLVNNHAFVCFRPGEDVFIILSYIPPKPEDFHKDLKYPTVLKSTGLVFYNRYKNGVSEEFQMAVGEWTKVAGVSDVPSFSTTPNEELNASIGESEEELDTKYKNLAGGSTSYSLKIRHSTLRFSELFQWAVPKDAKDKENSDRGQDSNNGYCAEFK